MSIPLVSFDEFLAGKKSKKPEKLSLNSNNGRKNNFGKMVCLRENRLYEAHQNEKSLKWVRKKINLLEISNMFIFWIIFKPYGVQLKQLVLLWNFGEERLSLRSSTHLIAFKTRHGALNPYHLFNFSLKCLKLCKIA